MTHDWDWMTDICRGCGLFYCNFLNAGEKPHDCDGSDPRTYLVVRHRMEAFCAPILENLGFQKPETRH